MYVCTCVRASICHRKNFKKAEGKKLWTVGKKDEEGLNAEIFFKKN